MTEIKDLMEELLLEWTKAYGAISASFRVAAASGKTLDGTLQVDEGQGGWRITLECQGRETPIGGAYSSARDAQLAAEEMLGKSYPEFKAPS